MRKHVIGAMVVTMALGLTACGGDSGDDASAGKGKGKTLTVWIMEGTNPDARPFFNEVSADFKKKTGVTVDVEYQQWTTVQKKFTTAIEGGASQVPDVAEVGTTWIPQFAETGALVDVTDKVKAAGLSTDLVPGLADAGTLDGKQYGMPWYAGVRALLYRKDVFDKYHLKAPTNWDELRETALELKKKEPDMIPFPVAGSAEMNAVPFIWGAGGDLAKQEGGTWKSTINSPASVKGIQYYTDLAKKDGLSPAKVTTWTEKEIATDFQKGKIAMTLSGSWTPKAFVAAAPDLKGKLAAAPIPGEKGGLSKSFLGGSYLSTFKGDNQETAWEFVKMVTTGKYATEWAEQSNYFPGQNSLLKQVEAKNDPLVAPFAKQMTDGGATVPKTPAYGEIQAAQVVPKMVQSILTGKQTAQEAADQAAKEMDKIFAS